MLSCLAIDDEPLALRQLQGYIAKTGFLHLERAFTRADEAEAWLAEHPVDLLFVDINMPDRNGIDFVRSLSERPMVIFTTAYSEYAIEGFKLDAIDYLLKPFSFNDFHRAVSKARSLHELIAAARVAEPGSTSGSAVDGSPEAVPRDREFISIKDGKKTSLVRISDIVYIESVGEYVRLHLDGQPAITTLFRLKNMEAALPADLFMRVHRSYLINLQRIKGYARDRVFLSENEQDYIPIGENHREAFTRYVKERLQGL